MSGVLRRTAMWSHYKDGVYDTGWRRVVTGAGSMIEPGPFSAITLSCSNTYDKEYGDQIGHIDDIEWTRYKDRNRLSGTVSGVAGSADGWVHGGEFFYNEQV